MWQDLLPERWEACDDRQAALEAGDGFRCGGNGVMEKRRARWYPGQAGRAIWTYQFRLHSHSSLGVGGCRLAPEKRKVFLSDGRMFPDFQDVNL